MQFIFSNANEKKQTLMRGDVHRGPHSVPSGMDPSSTRETTKPTSPGLQGGS